MRHLILAAVAALSLAASPAFAQYNAARSHFAHPAAAQQG